MKQIKEYPNYSITEDGKVWSHISNKWLKQNKRSTNAPYMKVSLGKKVVVNVHRLVALAYIPNPDNKPMVNHINGIKTSNTVDNLEWVTQKENAEHAVKEGLYNSAKGDTHCCAKLTTSDIHEIRDLLRYTKFYQREIGEFYGVGKGTIGDIKRGKNWKHI